MNREMDTETPDLDTALDQLRGVASGEAVDHDALDAVLSELWLRMRPHERDEAAMAADVGGFAPQLVRLGQRQVHRRLAQVSQAMRDPAATPAGVARVLGGLEALVEAQIATERWLDEHTPRTAEPSGTRCEWCGADYPEPAGD